MALPFVGGPLDGQRVAHYMPIAGIEWDLDNTGLVWRELAKENLQLVPTEDALPFPVVGSLSYVKHRYILKCRGEFLLSNCWLEYAGVVS